MKTLLKDCIRPLYHYLKDSKIRELNRLFDKWGGEKRYIEIKNIKFLDYTFIIPDFPSFFYQCKEIFNDEIYRFKSEAREPIIYDCGANVGVSVIYFKSLYPNAKITAFEADRHIASYLAQNLKANNINDVSLITKAVWNDDSGICFLADGADGGAIVESSKDSIQDSTNSTSNNIAKDSSNMHFIPSIRLRDMLEREDSVDFLKLDIEGAEVEVLRDCKDSLGHVQNLFVEYHSFAKREQSLGEILDILSKANFRYSLTSINYIRQPFCDKILDNPMDLQVNISAFRI